MRDDAGRVQDMLEAIAKVERYAALGRARFEADELIHAFIAHQLMTLGECASRLSPELCEANPDVVWNRVIGTRNVLVHDYFRADPDIVWRAVEQDLPPLRVQLERILRDLEGASA